MGEHLYEYTNESLSSIMHGLLPMPGDVVVSVLGSGDQSFALLENRCKVVAVDMNPAQVTFSIERKKMLEEDNYAGFLGSTENFQTCLYFGIPLSHNYLWARNQYFNKEKFRRIRIYADNVTMHHDDIIAVTKREQPDKLYLSNALDTRWMKEMSEAKGKSVSDITREILETLATLPVGARLYTAHVGSRECDLSKAGFQMNDARTSAARRYNQLQDGFRGYGDPKVYDKIA